MIHWKNIEEVGPDFIFRTTGFRYARFNKKLFKEFVLGNLSYLKENRGKGKLNKKGNRIIYTPEPNGNKHKYLVSTVETAYLQTELLS